MYWVTCFLLVAVFSTFKILGDNIIDDKWKEAMNQLVETDKQFKNFTGTNFFSDGVIFPLEKEDPPLKNIAFKFWQKDVTSFCCEKHIVAAINWYQRRFFVPWVIKEQ